MALLLNIAGCATPSDSSTGKNDSAAGKNDSLIDDPDDPHNGDYRALLDDAIDLLLEQNFDGGISKIKAAYAAEKNDETKMYYALAELASISVDDSVKKILTENFGFTNYPAKMNSLISGDWMKEYIDAERVSGYKFSQNDSGNYVRVSGIPRSSSDGSSTAYISYEHMEDMYFSYSYNYDYLTGISADSDGDYLISTYSYSAATGLSPDSRYCYAMVYTAVQSSDGSYLRVNGTKSDTYVSGPSYVYCVLNNGEWDDVDFYLTDVTVSATGKYLINYDNNNVNGAENAQESRYDLEKQSIHKYVKSSDSDIAAPGFKVPSWFKSSDVYTETLIGSVQTAETLELLILANLLDCNMDGFNDLIDNILAVFDTKFENALSLADSISNASVTIPTKVIKAFELEEMFGDTTVKVGKAELNVLIGAVELLRGYFQYISAYDLSANFDKSKVLLSNSDASTKDELIAIQSIPTTKMLTSRNAAAIEGSKKSFLDAAQRFMDSYNFLINDSEYPAVAKDELYEYGNIWYKGVQAASNAIKNGTIFYLPDSDAIDSGLSSWPTSSNNAAFGIDMGKMFTAGTWCDIIKRSSNGTIALYCDFYDSDSEPEQLTDTLIEKLSSDDYDYDLGLMVNISLIDDILPGIFDESIPDNYYEFESFWNLSHFDESISISY